MSSQEGEDQIERLQTEVAKANANAKDCEEKMMQAALYGRDLLEKNLSLETQVETLKNTLLEKEASLESQMETARQETYEINLRLQAKLDLEKSLTSELESLRESLKTEEKKIETMKEEEDERISKREEELKLRLSETEQELDCVRSKELHLQDLVHTLEKQLEESNSALNKSIGGDSIAGTVETLQQENMSLLQSKQTLEVDLTKAREEVESLRLNIRSLEGRMTGQQEQLEELQSEMGGYTKSIEAQKIEILELQALLEAERNCKVEQDGKGNSLFSEVEDRRQRVESQLSSLTSKYNSTKERYDAKVAELQKVKMHNSQLLSIVGTRSDSEHVERLEELVSIEKEKVRMLTEKLNTIDRLATSTSQNSSSVQAEEKTGESLMDTDSSVDVSHDLQSTEYKYLAHLLEQANNKNKEFEQEMRSQVRKNMEESDKQRELCRKLHNTEQQINKLKAENYTLKIQLEEVKSNNTVKENKKEPKKKGIIEKINFSDEQKENKSEENQEEFNLKETVKKSVKPAVTENEENAEVSAMQLNQGKDEETEDPQRKRRGIVLCDKVEEINVDGERVEKDLIDQKQCTEKIVRKKPRGARKHFGGGEVQRAEEDPECKQQ